MKTKSTLNMNVRYIRAGLLGIMMAVLSVHPVQSETLYWGGGTTDIPDGTPLTNKLTALSGTWDTTTKNWATDSSGTTYTNWPAIGTNTHAYLGANMTTWVNADVANITLAGDLSVNRLSANFTAINAFTATFSLTSAVPVTLTFSGENPQIYVDDYALFENITFQSNVRLAGTAGVRTVGVGDVRVYSDASALTGVATINDPNIHIYEDPATCANSGMLKLFGSGNLRGISRFDSTGNGANGLIVEAPAVGVQDQLGDSAEVNLMGGRFSYKGYRGTPFSQETIDRIRLDGSGILDLSTTSGAGGSQGQLILANATAGINRGTDGKGCLQIGVSASDTVLTDAIVQNGVATEVVLPWMLTTRGKPVQLDAAKTIVPVATVTAPLDLSTWAAGSKYWSGGGTYVNSISSLAIDSLGFYSGDAATITIADANTLTLSLGLLGRGYTGAGIGTVTLTGGKLTSGISELYVIPAHRFTAMTINSEITGNLSLIIGGNGPVTLGGTAANTYTGTTYVLGGQVNLSKSGAVPGDLVIARARVRSGGTGYFAVASNVTVRAGGVLETFSYSPVISGLVTLEGNGRLTWGNTYAPTFNKSGTGLVMNGGELIHTHATIAGIASLLTDVSYGTDSASQAIIRYTDSAMADAQYINLCDSAGSYTRTFNIGSSTNVTGGKPEMEIAMQLREVTGTAGITKTGAGALALRRTHYSLSGPVNINGGRLISAGTWQSVTRQGRIHAVAGTRYKDYTVIELSRTDDLVIGQPVSGTGIPTGAVIASIDSPTQISLSYAPTSIGTPTLTFTGARGGMGKAQVISGTRTSGSKVITGLSTTNGLCLRQPVTGTGVSGYIESIDSATQITLSANASSSGTSDITFTGGSAVGRGLVTINSTGILMGDGVAGTVTNNSGGVIDAGVVTNQAATMQFGNGVVFMAGSTQQVDIASASVNDQLQVFGDITLDGAVNPNLLDGYDPSEGTWTIATYTGTATDNGMTAPEGYAVTIDSGNKRVLLSKSPASTGFIMGIY